MNGPAHGMTSYETDWLASRPVFYNRRTGAVSERIAEVIDFDRLEIDESGLRDYLDFGYSVLGNTPLTDVKFLPACSRLTVLEDGAFRIEALHDPVDDWLERITDEREAVELLQAVVREWERTTDGPIVIPTSGGYDSRLLNLLIHERSRIRAFTYGISTVQSESREVVHARLICEKLGIQWRQIQLGEFNMYLEPYIEEFGVSSHAEGMYHMEFYAKILPFVGQGAWVLSGIVGDAWAGNHSFHAMSSAADVQRLTELSYGVRMDPRVCGLSSSSESCERFFATERRKLELPWYRVVTAIRLKMMMLRYLCRVPECLGYRVWSPFLLPEVALAMLTIAPARREGRLWQRDLFRKHGLDLDGWPTQGSLRRIDSGNVLDLCALSRVPLPPLEASSLDGVVPRNVVDAVNRDLRTKETARQMVLRAAGRIPKLRGVLARHGLESDLSHTKLEAYRRYVVLLPLAHVLAAGGTGPRVAGDPRP
jgi:hypothetical protein